MFSQESPLGIITTEEVALKQWELEVGTGWPPPQFKPNRLIRCIGYARRVLHRATAGARGRHQVSTRDVRSCPSARQQETDGHLAQAVGTGPPPARDVSTNAQARRRSKSNSLGNSSNEPVPRTGY